MQDFTLHEWIQDYMARQKWIDQSVGLMHLWLNVKAISQGIHGNFKKWCIFIRFLCIFDLDSINSFMNAQIWISDAS